MHRGNTAAVIPNEPKTRGYYLRRGTLYGAAFGMLLGLAHVAVIGGDEPHAIKVWRNWIVGGACVGLIAGAIRGVFFIPSNDDDHSV